MSTSFIAYIDESGDEGFVFNADGSGSSRWFVLSAAVIRRANDLQLVSCLKATRSLLQGAENAVAFCRFETRAAHALYTPRRRAADSSRERIGL